ncbi:MAG: hypothetical protein WAW52_14835, partial [Methanothrix sp.]
MINSIIKILLTIIMVLIFTTSAFSANYYVRSGATGNGSGSDWINAYTSLPSTLSRGTDSTGSIYYIGAGKYEGYHFSKTTAPVDRTKVITIKKATVADHGTDTGWSAAYA